MSTATPINRRIAKKLPAGNFGPNGLEMLAGFALFDAKGGAENG